jgi:hypothetical protein
MSITRRSGPMAGITGSEQTRAVLNRPGNRPDWGQSKRKTMRKSLGEVRAHNLDHKGGQSGGCRASGRPASGSERHKSLRHQVCLKPGSKTGWTSERGRISINCLRRGSEPQPEAKSKSLLQHISEKVVKFTLCEKMGSEHLSSKIGSEHLLSPCRSAYRQAPYPPICAELCNTASAPAIPERQAPWGA